MSRDIIEQGGVYPFPPEEAVENIVLGVMEECSARMHEMFAAGKNDQAEAYRLRLEGAARVAQKLGYLKAAAE